MAYRAIVDTNILLRIITGDLPDVARRLVKDIAVFPKESIWLGEAVFAEVIFVLSSPKQYGLSRLVIQPMCREILATKQFACDRALLEAALNTFATTKLDFVDCLILAYKQTGKIDQIITLDKQLLKQIT